ncbi:hypothetical protein E7Z59_10085 [Robertkochia marina]|uniref:Uncharacterized protein n=1 Tax=Robertkochia marina TaxID=1227945 RepID=A0A4V3UY72_9FLAO|nr:hypothetical protein [Robertkochia marina]THD67986.1 hypothetical protein E7Z59_10085 [Robertkochia marina]TRZ41518.1 hypothetical protein D3A96_13025 [Robertkochia marina]
MHYTGNQKKEILLTKPDQIGDHRSDDFTSSESREVGAKKTCTNFFLTDQELKNIKERIRRKHHSATRKLLLVYGLILVAFIVIVRALGWI